jgi:hypothetical protein
MPRYTCSSSVLDADSVGRRRSRDAVNCDHESQPREVVSRPEPFKSSRSPGEAERGPLKHGGLVVGEGKTEGEQNCSVKLRIW